ncbi:MAG: group III truncated hemoglobin [Helicobacter sp.]|nr:group III truncated hemoglobin [Helicobacteraceae bacterium]MDY3113983.1 group III truncated hemoglobin [Helicobacter sp.]
MKKYDTICIDGINTLMDIFYAKIRVDKSGLGEVFNNAIGVSDEVWEAHKKKIANFWQGMLLGLGDYSGQPLKVHLELPPFPREFFEIWLELFDNSLRQVFCESVALEILQKAQMIAKRFSIMIYDLPH